MFKWLQRRIPLEKRLDLQRRRARARADQYAERLDFPVQWDCGAPMPHLLVNEQQALLAFVVREPDPSWNGLHVTVQNPWSEQAEPLALVEFEHCLSAKLGAPNDEVFGGHPLAGKGLEPYSAQKVVNSLWLRELQTINSVHHRYNPTHWHDLNHYIFWFHDSTFECIAKSFRVETCRESMKSLLGRMVERLISWPDGGQT